MRITFVFALLLILLVTIFVVQNNASIDIKLLFWKINGSLALVLVIAFILGILIGFLVSTPTAIRKHSQMAELRKKLHMVETDLEEARNAMAALSMEKPVQDNRRYFSRISSRDTRAEEFRFNGRVAIGSVPRSLTLHHRASPFSYSPFHLN